MLLRAIKRSAPLVPRSKTLRFIRQFQSSTESKDFFSSTQPSYAATTTKTFSKPSDPPRVANPTASKLTSFLRFTYYSAVAATVGTAGYATYAYTADEVDEKTKSFRSSINYPLVDSNATIENLPHLVYNAVMAVPSKAVDTYLDLRRLIEERVQEIAEPASDKLLPDWSEVCRQHGIINQQNGEMSSHITLVLDLRGTLIYNEWKRETGWRTYKRPGLDDFLRHMAPFCEIVIYCDDPTRDDFLASKFFEKGVMHFLTRNDTKYQDGKHYRDLSKLNRDPSRIIYVSGHALDNCLQPENCIPIKPWNKEVDDRTLIDLIPFLEFVISKREIRGVLAAYKGTDMPSEFIQRSKSHFQNRRPPLPWRRNFKDAY